MSLLKQFPRSFRSMLTLAAFLAAGCASKQSDVVVATVGSTPIRLSEYEAMYEKSNGGSREQAAKSTQEEREKFLELMTNFKLKLADAYGQKIEARPEIQKEIDQYRGSLAASFLTEREVTQPGVRRLYDGRRVEIRASHILLGLSNPTPEDSARVYKTADTLIRLLQKGARFDSLARIYSQDPSVSQNGGDLYYFTGGQMVPPFEDAAFAMQKGEISSKPVRTMYGLHIIKLVDRKSSPGETRCGHIMIRFEKQDPAPEDTLAAFKKVKAIQDSLSMGLDFGELAKRNSGDPGSAPHGGDLGWFARRRWIQPFDEIAFTLNAGQVSGIVRTVYGYHLIKCYETRPPKSFEDSKKELQQYYQQSRYQEDYQKLLDKLKKETRFTISDPVVSALTAALDSTKTTRDSAWSAGVTKEVGSLVMMRFGQRPVTVDSVVTLIKARPDMGSMSLYASSVRGAVDKIVEQLLFQTRAEGLDKENPEFAGIMKEYIDGILLYQIEQERVWNRVAVNDSVLRHYFEGHREKFMWPDRVNITWVALGSDSVARLVYTWLGAGKSIEEIAAMDSARIAAPTAFAVSFVKNASKLTPKSREVLSAVAAVLKGDPALKVQLTVYADTTAKKKKGSQKLAEERTEALKSSFAKALDNAGPRVLPSVVPGSKDSVDLQLIGRAAWIVGTPETDVLAINADERTQRADSLTPGAFTEPFKFRGIATIVRLNRKEPMRQKTFAEGGPEVSSAFQEYESKRLEQEWLDGLRKRHPVVHNKEGLKNAFAPAE